MLALFLSVLTSSSSMGIALSLAYYFIEVILVRILGGLFGWFSNVSDFLLGPNVIAWTTETRSKPRVATPLCSLSRTCRASCMRFSSSPHTSLSSGRLPSGCSSVRTSPERGVSDRGSTRRWPRGNSLDLWLWNVVELTQLIGSMDLSSRGK